MAEMARKAGMDNTTAFRFLNTLVDIGYAERVPDRRKFRLALKVLDLGFNAIARSALRTRARPILREARPETGWGDCSSAAHLSSRARGSSHPGAARRPKRELRSSLPPPGERKRAAVLQAQFSR
jgi:DNA-binding IclR family transcriptional regulator